MRLLLVHLYRHVLLADPLLPAEVIPAGWPGPKARQLAGVRTVAELTTRP